MLGVITLLGVLFAPVAAAPQDTIDVLLDMFLKVGIIFVLMINVIDSRDRLRSILSLVVVSGTIFAALAIKSYLIGDFVVLEKRDVGVVGLRITGAVGGFFGNPNDLATTLDMLLPLAVALALLKHWVEACVLRTLRGGTHSGCHRHIFARRISGLVGDGHRSSLEGWQSKPRNDCPGLRADLRRVRSRDARRLWRPDILDLQHCRRSDRVQHRRVAICSSAPPALRCIIRLSASAWATTTSTRSTSRWRTTHILKSQRNLGLAGYWRTWCLSLRRCALCERIERANATSPKEIQRGTLNRRSQP